jgi:O-antigen biosynthesis protein WbqP
MRVDAPGEMATSLMPKSGAYITRAGRFLRMTSLDELPQLFNILIGDMSFVGFRPCLWNEYELDDERRKTGAYRVRPGITGIAQIRGRDELRPAEKARLDGVYARHVGFDYDLRIVTKTILYVFYKEGYREGGFADE